MKYLFYICLFAVTYTQEPAFIKGNVFDKATGEALIGANVYIEGTTFGASTDLDGNFSFKIDPGTYNITIDYVSYQKKIIKDITVSQQQELKLDISLEEEALTGDVVIVEAQLIDRNENGLLIAQKKSNKIFDAISSEQIKRSGDGNVGAALKRVTGVSLVNGKNVFVRGLGDRYSNVQLNGSILPSVNPDKREVPVQIFSSSVIDNIIVNKTYSADQSAEFSGGSVQIKTKDFPGFKALTVGVGTSYNSFSTGENYLTYEGGGLDFLGYDDGTRELPAHLRNNGKLNQNSVTAFNNQWTPIRKTSTPSQKYSLSFVDEYIIDDRPLGIVSSFSYGTENSRKMGQFIQVTTPNTNLYSFDTETGNTETNLSGMVNVFYKFSPNFKVGLKNLYVNSSEDQAKLINGLDFNAGGTTPLEYQQTLLKFVQSRMFTSNLITEVYMPDFYKSKLKTEVSYASAKRYEPDTRRTIRQVNDDNSLTLVTGRQMGNSHFFSDQNDQNITARSNIQMDITPKINLHTGAELLIKDRAFQARRFNYKGGTIDPNHPDFDADPETVLDPANVLDGSLVFEDISGASDQFDGSQTVVSGFVSADIKINPSLQIIAGARVEAAKQKIELNKPLFGIDAFSNSNTDVLPALNIINRLNDDMNLRFAYSSTLARPEFRELAPFSYSDFIGSIVLNGNPDLQRTKIQNLDLRFEYYFAPGEMIAVSSFYKLFDQPIEKIFRQTENNEQFFVNADEAELIGFEIEFRKSLNQHLKFTSNFSVIESTVNYASTGSASFAQANTERPLYGQSPYTVNGVLSYDFLEPNIQMSVSFNRFGKRVSTVGSFLQKDDEYEMPFDKLDFSAAYKFSNYKIILGVQNILDEKVVFKQNDTITNTYTPGITSKISFDVTF